MKKKNNSAVQSDLLSIIQKQKIFGGLGNILTGLIKGAIAQIEIEEQEIDEILGKDFWNDKKVIYLLKLVQTFKLVNELSKDDELRTVDEQLQDLDEDAAIIKRFVDRQIAERENVIDLRTK